MLKSLLTFFCLFVVGLIEAQTNIIISGQIEDKTIPESLLITNGEVYTDVNISQDGTFNVELSYNELPGFFQLRTMTKKRFVPLSKRFWFKDKSIEIVVNLENNSIISNSKEPYQGLSEKIEGLNGKKQIESILNNPSQLPSLYFADYLKKDIGISELEEFLKNTSQKFTNSNYYKRLQSYVNAKKRPPIKKGELIEDFSLPTKSGDDYAVIGNSNKTKLIALFSSSCAYSIASIDLLAQLNALNNDQIEIITIWKDSSEYAWLNNYKEEKAKINWINLWDEFEFAQTYFDSDFSPQYFVINSDGVVTDKFRGLTKKTAMKLGELLE